MSPEERTYECERCGHAYSDSYGTLVEHANGASWVCHSCLRDERQRRRARRIAESVGDAQAVEVGASWAVVCDTYDALVDAERLIASQHETIDIYSSEQVESCDVCGVTESRTGAGTLAPGWAEQEDSNGDLIGFLCPEHAGTR